MTMRITITNEHTDPSVAACVRTVHEGQEQSPVDIPAGENRSFYIHSTQHVSVEEVPVAKATA